MQLRTVWWRTMESNSALFAAVGAWIAQDPDPQTQQALRALLEAQDAQALAPLFAGRIAFGTAGLRALMGPGPRAMNRLVVQQSTLGILRVLGDEVQDLPDRGVVVAYDGRLGSKTMAHDAAGILAAQGVRVHLFERAVPTPVAGFAVKKLRAAAGIVITASHNPPAYNGLKVFWHNGAQIVPPTDGAIAQAIDEVAQSLDAKPLPCLNQAQMLECGRLTWLGQAMTEAYLSAIESLSPQPQSPQRSALSIAYTPLHGVGADCALAALKRAGFTAVHTVAAQQEPDGHFPTVRFPNPEEPGSMDAVLELAHKTGAILACANDPDADRLAVAARDANGAMTLLTGDELGLLLADDILRHAPPNAAVGTTLVSARGLARLAQHYGAHYFETLTGFKWLAQKARTQALAGRQFAFAYEEALGYAIGDAVWDKDGISALLSIAKLAAALMADKQTLWHRLADIAQKVGVAVSSQATIALDASGAQALMAALREAPPRAVGPFDVVSVSDLMNESDSRALGLPTSNVVLLHLQERTPTAPVIGHARIIVRPSGTEPKIKCYYDMLADLGPEGTWAGTRAGALDKLHTLMRAHQTLGQKD